MTSGGNFGKATLIALGIFATLVMALVFLPFLFFGFDQVISKLLGSLLGGAL